MVNWIQNILNTKTGRRKKMIDYRQQKKQRDIENGFEKYPWLKNYLQRDVLQEFTLEDKIVSDFYKSRVDSFGHIEVMLLLGEHGELLGEVDEIETPKGLRGIFSFAPRHEMIMQAIWRIPGETFFVLKKRNTTHATLYKAPENMSLREHSREFVQLF
jgi:hypothetical protein